MVKATQNGTTIFAELARLQKMELGELKDKWYELYGRKAPECGRLFLQRQLAFRIQELRYGGLSEASQAALDAIGNEPRPTPEKNANGFLVGTRFERVWKEKICVATASADGFEYKGKNYKSLSAIAHAITGTQWSGKRFFGVK